MTVPEEDAPNSGKADQVQPPTIPLAQPMLTAEEIVQLQAESADAMREFQRQLQKRKG